MYAKTSNGLYYKYLYGTQEEQLLYNYNLELNDTIRIPDVLGYKDSSFYIVSNIENVYIDGSIKKKYLLVYPEYNNYKETWIESIGSLQGILWPGRYGAGSIPILLCCFHDSELIYKNPDYDRCYYSVRPTTGINTIKATSFKIFPTRTDQNITVQFPDKKQRKISIYNSCGTLIEEFVCYESEKIFNISNYQTGLYLIVSVGENNKSQKFIKY